MLFGVLPSPSLAFLPIMTPHRNIQPGGNGDYGVDGSPAGDAHVFGDFDFGDLDLDELEELRAAALVAVGERPRNQPGQISLVMPTTEELARCTTNRQHIDLASWYTRFNEWLIYYRIHGHGNVPQKKPESKPKVSLKGPSPLEGWNKQLGNWVNKQRREKTDVDKGKMSPYMYQERIEILETHGFRWAKQKDMFDTHYKKLVEYHLIIEDARVPVKPFTVSDDKTGPTPEQQVEQVAAKLLQGRVVNDDDYKMLVTLLLDQPFTRWITELRVKHHKWQAFVTKYLLNGLDKVPVKLQRKYQVWCLQKEKLDELGFRFGIIIRRRSY
ncbi:hypothetical protein MPSEU_000112500 [Mayamaea pseudoterrestris]|nr:hypothetical protein MPSEU_000112500 [Mayamaea pseudoterrestris]